MCVQILRHTLHAHGTNGGDAGRFDPLEHFLGRAALWAIACMQLRIVVTETQGKLIANPAHGIYFCLIRTHSRHGQAQHAPTDHRWASAKHDIQFIIASDGANRRRCCPLERLYGIFSVRHIALRQTSA